MRLFGSPNVGKLKARGDVEGLIKVLCDSGRSHLRRAAAMALGELGSAQAIQSLVAALDDEEPSVRSKAADALGEIGDPRAVEPLIDALADPLWDVRQVAVRSLGKVGDPRAVEPLFAALRDGNASLAHITESLAELGAPGVECLMSVLNDEEWIVRKAAAEALGQIGDPRAIEPLIARLEDVNKDVRWATAMALDAFGWQPDTIQSKAAYWTAKEQWGKFVELDQPAVTDHRDIAFASQYTEQGWECRHKEDLEGAMQNFSQALARNPQDVSALFGLGVALCMAGQLEESIKVLDKALSLQPHHAGARTERGLAYAFSGDLARAVADYREALAIDPVCVPTYLNRGQAYAQQGERLKALEDFNLGIRLGPRYADLYLVRGDNHAALGNHRHAAEDFQTYLRLKPRGPYAEYVEANLQRLQGEVIEHEKPAWAVLHEAWQEFVVLGPQNSVDELVRSVQQEQAFHVVVCLPGDQYSVASVYGRHGLRDRFSEIADVIGRDVLDIELGQFLDLWRICTPIGPTATQEQTRQACAQSDGRTIVAESDQIMGIFESSHTNHYPEFPTRLFGTEYTFPREGGPHATGGSRRCRHCDGTFGYYEPVFEDDMLAGYACPHCASSPILDWVEARMRPQGWSNVGFLGEEESLAEVIAEDDRTLDRLGVTHEQVSDALDHLLDAATAAYEQPLADALERWLDSAQQAQQGDDVLDHGSASERSADDRHAELFHALDDLERKIQQGEVPSRGAGVCVGEHQVFLQSYAGYQYCPWTVLRQPWSSDPPAAPMRFIQREGGGAFVHVTGLALHCQHGVTYRYADCDFLIFDRDTGEYLRGPGLIVHLIRDHHFFEGEQSPHRVDPEQAIRALRLD